jgi:hypothetical protein
MEELVGHRAWRTLLGREVAATDLHQTETEPERVRRDFASGIPMMTYAEKYIIEEMLDQTGRSLSEEDKAHINEMATRTMDRGLVPATITAGNTRAFNFSNRATLRSLRRQIRPTETCPTVARPWVAPPRNLLGCLRHYYRQGRERLRHPRYRDTECRNFIVANRRYIDNAHRGGLYYLYSLAEQYPEHRSDYIYRVGTWADEIREHNRTTEIEECRASNEEIERQNQLIQPIIDVARGAGQRYFEWIIIRQRISDEWENTAGTSGERTAEQDAHIRAIQDAHLTFLHNRIGRALRGYTYQGLP